MESNQDHADASDREYFRVAVRLALRCRPLRPGEFDDLRREIEMPRYEVEGVPPALREWLWRIEDKLDYLVAGSDSDRRRPLDRSALRDVVISGAGARFAAKDEGRVGEDVLLELVLPGPVSTDLRAVARVVRRIEPKKAGEEAELAVAWRVIHEQDREAIVRFARDVERAELRTRLQPAGDA